MPVGRVRPTSVAPVRRNWSFEVLPDSCGGLPPVMSNGRQRLSLVTTTGHVRPPLVISIGRKGLPVGQGWSPLVVTNGQWWLPPVMSVGRDCRKAVGRNQHANRQPDAIRALARPAVAPCQGSDSLFGKAQQFAGLGVGHPAIVVGLIGFEHLPPGKGRT